MSNDPFKWSTPPRGSAPANSPCIEHDNVSHPAHYTAGGVECIDAIAAALTCQKDPMQAWLTGQVLKYMWRWPLKNGKEDLRKAGFYLDRLINSAGDDWGVAMSTFPGRLRRLRERQQLKRCVLSELCGLNRNTIKRYEMGTQKPSMDALISIADYFGVSIDYLLGRSDYPKSL